MLVRRLLPFLIAIAATSAFAGWRDDAPGIKDPYEGLLPVSVLKPGSNAPIADPAKKRLAIVMSGNSNVHLKWTDEAAGIGVESADRFFGTMFAGASRMAEFDKQLAETYRAQLVTAALLQPLVDSFKEVKLMNDFAEFRDSGFEMALLLDVTFLNTFHDGFIIGASYETATSVRAQFIAADFSKGPLVEVTRKQSAQREQYIPTVLANRKAVFAEYAAAVQRVAPAPAKPQATAVSAAVASPASAGDRLRQIEQLRRDGLITEAEAAAKRKQVLEGM